MNNRLLIVDDMDINRDILRAMFEDEYAILEATSGEEALSLARQYEDELALVLLDIQMPGLSGLDILCMRQNGEVLANVPIIIITATDNPETQIEAFRLGALDYITKPFVAEIVEYRVANASLRAAYHELNELAQEKERALTLARQASQAKSRFLTRMSHELRTPLHAIIGLVDLLRQGPDDAPSLLDHIDTSAHYQPDLINEMMDISEIESGKAVLHPKEMQLSTWLDALISSASVRAAKKDVQFSTDLRVDTSTRFVFDAQRLQEALASVLDNAIKFTDSRGSVRLCVEQLDDMEHAVLLRFTVEDTGVGIDADFLPNVFDDFETEDSGNTTRYGGVGLGLAIAKATVELMGGTIRAESVKHEGSRFILDIPFTYADAARSFDDTLADDLACDFAGKTFLLAEDNAINLMIAVRLLESCHAIVVTVEDGRQAVECFEKAPVDTFDAVLMDIRMPVMDGLDAARIIRALDRPDAKSVPMIAMSANASKEDVQKSLRAGLDMHLTKPIDTAELFSTLARFVL